MQASQQKHVFSSFWARLFEWTHFKIILISFLTRNGMLCNVHQSRSKISKIRRTPKKCASQNGRSSRSLKSKRKHTQGKKRPPQTTKKAEKPWKKISRSRKQPKPQCCAIKTGKLQEWAGKEMKKKVRFLCESNPKFETRWKLFRMPPERWFVVFWQIFRCLLMVNLKGVDFRRYSTN